jgi:hypothetical protein
MTSSKARHTTSAPAAIISGVTSTSSSGAGLSATLFLPFGLVCQVHNCPDALAPRIAAALGAHLREHGARNWDLVREDPRFATVIGKEAGAAGHRRFWRWRKAVSVPTPADKTRPHEARAAAAEQAAWARSEAAGAAHANLPIEVSPAYLMHTGVSGSQNLGVLATLFNRALEDLERVRAVAMVDDPDGIGGKSATDPHLLLKANKTLLQVINMAMYLQDFVDEAGKQQVFYDAITNTIVTELADVPEAQGRVIQALADLNNHLGRPPEKVL